MIDFPLSIKQQLHKLMQEGSNLALMEIPEAIDTDGSTGIYKARNIQDVVWNGRTYKKFWFEFEAVEETTSGSIPELMCHTSNIGGDVEAVIIANDNFSGCTFTLTIVNSACLNETTPIFSVTLDIAKPVVDRTIASLKLTAENPLLLSYPSWHYHGSLCQYLQGDNQPRGFRGALCGYSGPYMSCDRTIRNCVNLGNQTRFGGQLGLQGQIVNA